MNFGTRARMATGALVVCLALTPATASAEWTDWIATSDLTFQYTDNLGDSAFESNESDDFSWKAHGLFGRVFQIADHTRATVGADISGEVFEQFGGLDYIQGGARLSIFHKLGLGDAPWVRLSGFGGYRKVDQNQRSGARGEVELTLGKRFTPRFDSSLAYLFTAQDGNKGSPALLMMGPLVGGAKRNVFDQQYHQFTLQGNFLVLPELMFTAGYTFRVGEFNSATSCSARLVATADVKAITRDGVFGGCLYRLSGTGHAGFAKFSLGLTDHISLDLGYRFNYMEADGLDYQRSTAQLLLYFRY